MNTAKFKSCLMKFSTEELKSYLGKKLVDTLIEWAVDDEPLFEKSKLAEMIMTIHGLNILKNKSFRLTFLSKLSEKEILSFAEYINVAYDDDLLTLATIVANTPWRDNNISNHLLSILGVENYFETEHIEHSEVNVIRSEDRFFELLDYQFVIKQRSLTHLVSNVSLNRFLIHMPTGTGKTKTAIHTLIHHYNLNLKKQGLIIWLAHTTELLQQAYGTFASVWKHLGNGEVNTFKLWGDYNCDLSIEYNGFMFCGLQKLMSIEDKDKTLFDMLVKKCSILIIDEAHKAAANRTRETIEKFMVKLHDMNDRALIGLTATPGRTTSDSVDNNKLTEMFDNKIVLIETDLMASINHPDIIARNINTEQDIIKYFQESSILAKIKKEVLTYPISLTPLELSNIRTTTYVNGYEDFSQKSLEIIGRNKSRNMAIMKQLRRLSLDNTPTIVFSCSVEHGQLLSSMLSIEGIKNGCVFGHMHPTERANVISEFKDRNSDLNILINYEVLTTGFDSTNIRCVFITRPTQSIVLYSQMLGRGLRGPKMGGNEECLLIDIDDNLKKYDEHMAFEHFNNYWKY